MARRQRSGALTAACVGAVAHQPRIGATAEAEAERIEQDRLAGAGLAGERTKPLRKFQIEPIDENHIADRQRGRASVPANRQKRSACCARSAADQLVGIGVPLAAGKVVTENRGGCAWPRR